MSYRVPVLEKFSWQEPVIDVVSSLPGSPAKGDRYVLTSNGKINWYDGSTWKEDTQAAGWRVYNKADGTYWEFNGTAWTNTASASGLKLTGDIDSTTTSIDWDLIANDASALSFDSTSKAGILEIVTLEGSEGIKTSGNMTVAGDLTVNGNVTYLNTTNTDIKDKIITLNKGGAATSAGGAGLEFEENAIITGYIKVTDADESTFSLKAPTGNALILDVNADSTLTLEGNLSVNGASAINQDVQTTATPTFAGAHLSGALDVAGNVSIVGTLDTTSAATFGSTVGIVGDATVGGTLSVTGAATLADVTADNIDASTLDLTGNSTIGGTLGVTGAATFGSTVGITGNVTMGAESLLTDGTASVTVANIKKAYDSRAKYDAVLGCVVFDDAALDTVGV